MSGTKSTFSPFPLAYKTPRGPRGFSRFQLLTLRVHLPPYHERSYWSTDRWVYKPGKEDKLVWKCCKKPVHIWCCTGEDTCYMLLYHNYTCLLTNGIPDTSFQPSVASSLAMIRELFRESSPWSPLAQSSLASIMIAALRDGLCQRYFWVG